MRYLFIHHNFPAQFRHIAPALAERGHEVIAIGSETARPLKGINLYQYKFDPPETRTLPAFTRAFFPQAVRAQLITSALKKLKDQGLSPDCIVVHPGWGEAMPLRIMFPEAKIVVYCEYHHADLDKKEDYPTPELPLKSEAQRVAVGMRNIVNLMALADCDAAIAPTLWQKSLFPKEFQHKIFVLHEGIDTNKVHPQEGVFVELGGKLRLQAEDEVITYVSRNLEPVRGFHNFMRALPEIMNKRPQAHVLIVGGDKSSYAPPPEDSTSWKDRYLNEVGHLLDPARVHFLGIVNYRAYLDILHISRLHIYLTYPFVLSWSLMEAMSAGCLILASQTPPVEELIKHGENGFLAPLLDSNAIAQQAIECLENYTKFDAIRNKARQDIVENYDCETKILPKMIAFLENITKTSR